MGDHSGCALNQRLDHKRGVGISFLALNSKLLFNQTHAFVVAATILARIMPLWFRFVEWTTIAIGRGDLVRFEEKLAIAFVKQRNVPKAGRANRVPVIGAFERKKAWMLRTSAAAR